jgi:hypothetical protein
MKEPLTDIAFVLDRSGSMESCAEQAVAGFNRFLAEQRVGHGQARLTLVLFDDQYEVPCASIPIQEMTELDASTYKPRGSTALLDAIGKTIDDLGARLAATPEADRPETVIVAILTDGLENASRRFTWTDISDRIARQRDVYQWQFFFLGANQDAIATAAQLHIAAANAATFVADGAGARSGYAGLSRKLSAMRMAKQPCHPLSSQQAKDLADPLEKLVKEEDANRREKRGKK